VVRSAARDLSVPQESFVLAPAQAARRGDGAGATPARLVVARSPAFDVGESFETGPVPLTIGRAGDNTVVLGRDDFASARHARVEAQRDGLWLIDLDSTNGTFVNGERVDGRRRLRDGDVVKVGDTELRVER
jgi:pSer/pThr/pTyr-binding forkhead associated (FHA) protein